MAHMTTQECLRKFVRASGVNEKDGHEFRKRNELSVLVGVSKQAGYDWFSRKVLPWGDYLLKLRLLLSLVGYQPAERQNLPEAVRACADQVALEIVTVDDIAKHVSLVSDTVLRILLGKAGTSPERLQLLQEFALVNHEKMLKKSQEWELGIRKIGLRIISRKNKEIHVQKPQEQNAQQTSASCIDTSKPLDAATSREVAVSALSLFTNQLGLLEKVINGLGKEGVLLDGDRMRVIEVAIKLLKVFGITPQVISRLQQLKIVTENDPFFATLTEIAKLATGKDKS